MKIIDKLFLSKNIMLFLIIALVFLPLTQSSQPASTHAAAFTPAQATTVTVNPGKLGNSVPPDFLGFSIELANTCSTLALDQQTPEFAQLFKNLGTGNMRFGGTTVESTTWSPNGTASCYWNNTVVTQSLIDNIFAFARKVQWDVMWTVNLQNFDPVQFPAEAAYAVNSGGSSLISTEFGNEANRYGISYSTFLSHWQAYYNAFRALAPSAPISGPSLTTTGWFPKMIADEGSKLAFATEHSYSGAGGGPNPPTIGDLLSRDTMQDSAARFASDCSIAQTQHLSMQINETDSYYHQGQPGVSDVFASALWGADYLFTALEQSITRMNIHGVPNNPNGNSKGLLNYYSPINSDGTPAPVYYALLLFHYAAANGQVAPVQVTSPINIVAHAVVGSDGKLRLVIINKDQVNTQTVNINTTQSYSQAVGIRLLAPALNAKTGITLGGSPVGSDGTWNPTNFEQITVNGPNSTVSVPAGSAIVITYS